MGEYVKKQGRQ